MKIPSPKLSARAITGIRLGGYLLALGGAGFLLHNELSYGQALEKQIASRSEEANRLVDQGRQWRHFQAEEKPKAAIVHGKLEDSCVSDPKRYRSFLEKAANQVGFDLSDSECGTELSLSNPTDRWRAVQEKNPTEPEKAEVKAFEEVPFFATGQASYASVLRFADLIQSGKTLAVVDRFSFARSSNFSGIFSGGGMQSFAREDEERETERRNTADLHQFRIEGRVFLSSASNAEGK